MLICLIFFFLKSTFVNFINNSVYKIYYTDSLLIYKYFYLGPIDSKSFSGLNSKFKIKPILPNNPNESVKKISLQRMIEIKEMRSNYRESSQTEDTTVKTESTELLNAKSK